jgi:hypothetical protein
VHERGSSGPSSSTKDRLLHESQEVNEDAAPVNDDHAEDIIDLCFSQCPWPPLQAIALNHASVPAVTSAAARAVVTPSAASCSAASGSSAATDASLPNALNILMQSSRPTTHASTKGPEPNALSLMMSSARKHAKVQQESSAAVQAGAGKRGRRGVSGKSNGKGLEKEFTGAKSGIDPRAYAPWLSVKSSGPVHIFEVPYSEHSSFNELRWAPSFFIAVRAAESCPYVSLAETCVGNRPE